MAWAGRRCRSRSRLITTARPIFSWTSASPTHRPPHSCSARRRRGSGFYAYVASTSNTSHGLPVTWSGTAPAGFNHLRPNMKLGYGTPLSVAPGATPVFVNGAWTGDLTLTGAAPAYAVLEATGGGATGTSAVLNWADSPPAAPVFDTEPGITQGTTNTVLGPPCRWRGATTSNALPAVTSAVRCPADGSLRQATPSPASRMASHGTIASRHAEPTTHQSRARGAMS